MNAAFGGERARLELHSDRMLLIDPLALDGLRDRLVALSAEPRETQASLVRTLGTEGLRVGLSVVPDFRAGTYELDARSFEAADARDPDDAVFEVDSGCVVAIDVARLAAVAQTLTWDRYDALLQSPPGDDSELARLNAEIGGPWFAIILADADAPFSGDGAFRLLPDWPRRVA